MVPAVKITSKGLRWFRRGHPWIFRSDLFAASAEIPAGAVEVLGPSEEFLGSALYSPRSQIALRMLIWKKEPIDEVWWRRKILRALEKRRRLKIPSTAVRLIYAEGDGLPSLIVDQYGAYLVVQILSAGLELYKEMVFRLLAELTKCEGILERSESAVRRKEGLSLVKEAVMGEVPREVLIEEAGLKFVPDLWEGQKTGAFLDQRSNRILAGERVAQEKCGGKILDVFSYDGWFACHMGRRGESVLCVESSKEAAERILRNAALNGLEQKISVEVADAFEFLKEADLAGDHYDAVNLDPPGFVKTGGSETTKQSPAFRAYKEINLRAMKLLRPKGLLITSSCSYHFSFHDFQKMLYAAANDARVSLQEKQIGIISPDHPVHPHFPEGNYLKCCFSEVKAS